MAWLGVNGFKIGKSNNWAFSQDVWLDYMSFFHGCIFCRSQGQEHTCHVFVESASTNIDLVLWTLEFPWMLCALRCLAPPQCWQGSWTWRIFEYDDPHNVEITKHLHFLRPIPAIPLVKMEILREFLESSTIHGLSYISSSKVKPKSCSSQS